MPKSTSPTPDVPSSLDGPSLRLAWVKARQHWRVSVGVVFMAVLVVLGYTAYQASQSSVCASAWIGQHKGPKTHTTSTYTVSVPYSHWYEVVCASDRGDVEAQTYVIMNRQPKLQDLMMHAPSLQNLWWANLVAGSYDPTSITGKTSSIHIQVFNQSDASLEQRRDELNRGPTEVELADGKLIRVPAEIIDFHGHPALVHEQYTNSYYFSGYTRSYLMLNEGKTFEIVWQVESKTETERRRYVQEFANEALAIVNSFKIL